MRAPGLMSTGAPAFPLRPWAHLPRSRGTMARPVSPRRLIDTPALRIGPAARRCLEGVGLEDEIASARPLMVLPP
jgi:hypothetical protein